VTSLVLTLRAHRSRIADAAGSASHGTFAPRDPASVRGAGPTPGGGQRAWTRRGARA
jgi:hypothetical protein